mmetsp:Transcript_18497/g.46168  ORF Transcript_18497/g.46168 Transcript_18497/m.46168 type:complete len:250 (-) Transcript_18497:317-1066(-)
MQHQVVVVPKIQRVLAHVLDFFEQQALQVAELVGDGAGGGGRALTLLDARFHAGHRRRQTVHLTSHRGNLLLYRRKLRQNLVLDDVEEFFQLDVVLLDNVGQVYAPAHLSFPGVHVALFEFGNPVLELRRHLLLGLQTRQHRLHVRLQDRRHLVELLLQLLDFEGHSFLLFAPLLLERFELLFQIRQILPHVRGQSRQLHELLVRPKHPHLAGASWSEERETLEEKNLVGLGGRRVSFSESMLRRRKSH